MAIRSSSGFSHLWPGVRQFSSWTHKTQHIQLREWRKREQSQTWVSYKRKKGEVCDAFVQLSVHLWTIVSMYSSEIPTKPQGMLTNPLMLVNMASGPTGSSSCLLSPVDCPILLTALGPCFPASSYGLVGDLTCKPFVWVSCQNRQRDPLTGTHAHRSKCHPSCHSFMAYQPLQVI